MNVNELADSLEAASSDMEYNYHVSDWKLLYECALVMRKQQEQINNLQQWEKRQLDVIENLNGRIERMIENASHHEGIAHAGGFEQGYEAGRKMGMQQERALWELAASTQEIMK